MNRGQVMSAAGTRAARIDPTWGQPHTAVPPDLPDPATGRLYWQVRFDDAPDGAARVMLVNPYSGWARPAPQGTVLRSLLYPVDAREVARCRPVRGTWILIVEEHPAGADLARLDQRLGDWNQRALANSLYPLFARRPLADGGWQLVYGWHREGGIPRLDGIATWIERRLERQARWVDLTGGE